MMNETQTHELERGDSLNVTFKVLSTGLVEVSYWNRDSQGSHIIPTALAREEYLQLVTSGYTVTTPQGAIEAEAEPVVGVAAYCVRCDGPVADGGSYCGEC